MKTKTYHGKLCFASNGEEDELLGLIQADKSNKIILASEIKEDIDLYGSFLSVKYFIFDKEINLEELQEKFLLNIFGNANCEYDVAYSEYTGYLWTDEEIKIGGHDLLDELKQKIGQYLIMEIHYSKNDQTAQSPTA